MDALAADKVAGQRVCIDCYGKQDKPEKIVAKVSQEMLAEMIGTTHSRVNFFMNKFRKLGFIKYNGEIYVNKSLLSVVLHD